MSAARSPAAHGYTRGGKSAAPARRAGSYSTRDAVRARGRSSLVAARRGCGRTAPPHTSLPRRSRHKRRNRPCLSDPSCRPLLGRVSYCGAPNLRIATHNGALSSGPGPILPRTADQPPQDSCELGVQIHMHATRRHLAQNAESPPVRCPDCQLRMSINQSTYRRTRASSHLQLVGAFGCTRYHAPSSAAARTGCKRVLIWALCFRRRIR